MPGWLLSALSMLGLGARAGAGGVLPATSVGGRIILPAAAAAGGVALADPVGGLLPFLGGRGGGVRRRRRRRALTQSDRNDIAFITATLGSTAGKQFAMIIASRVG